MARKKKNRRRRRRTACSSFTAVFPVLVFAASVSVFLRSLARTSVRRRSAQPEASTASSQPVAWFAQPVSVMDMSNQLIEDITIPDGPLPFPVLRDEDNVTKTSLTYAHTGSSWIPSFASNVLSTLPSHWLIESAPKRVERGGDSIFKALRNGGWIGCERPFHLVCKGVYRAIKATNAMNVANIGCERDVAWLPHIVRKLREEFRMIRLTCIGDRTSGFDGLDVKFVAMNVYEDAFPNDTELLVAYKLMQSETLIDGMKFLKNVKRSGTVDMLVVETFPQGDNKMQDGALKVNTAIAPFWFPAAVYHYSNEAENDENEMMEIVTVRVDEMFEKRNTPTMAELVDPRKRVVQE